MRKRLIVSGGDALRVFDGLHTQACTQTMLRGTGAVCAGNGAVYAACGRADGIWRLDERSLVPTGLFAAGPGVSRMLLSGDGTRLYALCTEADSVLMMDAGTGAPLMLCRVGVSPADMVMDVSGSVIAVAAGDCSEVVLLCAQSLQVLRRLPVYGAALGVAIAGERVYALSMSESLQTVLTTFDACGAGKIMLRGMPGALCAYGGGLAAATHERIYELAADGRRILRCRYAPGCAGRLCIWENDLMMTDVWSESLYIWKNGSWRCMAQQVKDICIQEQRGIESV